MFLAFKRITNVVAYDKVDTLLDYDFGPEINLLIKFPQQEFFWSPFENKASEATKKSCWSKKKSLADPHDISIWLVVENARSCTWAHIIISLIVVCTCPILTAANWH